MFFACQSAELVVHAARAKSETSEPENVLMQQKNQESEPKGPSAGDGDWHDLGRRRLRSIQSDEAVADNFLDHDCVFDLRVGGDHESCDDKGRLLFQRRLDDAVFWAIANDIAKEYFIIALCGDAVGSPARFIDKFTHIVGGWVERDAKIESTQRAFLRVFRPWHGLIVHVRFPIDADFGFGDLFEKDPFSFLILLNGENPPEISIALGKKLKTGDQIALFRFDRMLRVVLFHHRPCFLGMANVAELFFDRRSLVVLSNGALNAFDQKLCRAHFRFHVGDSRAFDRFLNVLDMVIATDQQDDGRSGQQDAEADDSDHAGGQGFGLGAPSIFDGIRIMADGAHDFIDVVFLAFPIKSAVARGGCGGRGQFDRFGGLGLFLDHTQLDRCALCLACVVWIMLFVNLIKADGPPDGGAIIPCGGQFDDRFVLVHRLASKVAENRYRRNPTEHDKFAYACTALASTNCCFWRRPQQCCEEFGVEFEKNRGRCLGHRPLRGGRALGHAHAMSVVSLGYDACAALVVQDLLFHRRHGFFAPEISFVAQARAILGPVSAKSSGGCRD